MVSRSNGLLLIAHAERHGEGRAVVDSQGSYTYSDLLDASARVATALLDGGADLREQRVAFLATPGFAWVAIQWGIWRAGGVAVPLPINSTKSELEYFVDDSQASISVSDVLAATLVESLTRARSVRSLAYDQALSCEPQSCRTSVTIGGP